MSEDESCVETRGAMETKERVAVVLHESRLERTFRAVCLNGAILAVGLSLGLVGTALPDLQNRTNTSFAALTKIFIGRGLGFLVGSIASNFLLSLTNQACWITSALVVLAVTIATIPSCTSLALLIGTLFLQGVACGVIKAGCGFICRHHFSRVDLAWGKTLFVSFAAGAFLAPLLFLPFTSIAITSTSKTGSLRYIEDLPVWASTVSTRLAPARNGLIAPNILARFHRKRRSIEEDTANETVTGIGSIEASTTLTVEEAGFSVGSTVKETPVPFESTEEFVTGEGGNKLGSSPVHGFLMDIVRVTDGGEIGRESSTVVTFSSLSAVSLPGSVTPVAKGVNISSSLPPQISPTVVGSTTTKAIPKKPSVVDGEMLSPDAKVADSSKYRNVIRDNIKNDIPDDVEKKTSTSVPALRTSISSTAANSPQAAPGVTSVALSPNQDNDLTTADAGQVSVTESDVSPPATNSTSSASSPPGPVQSSISSGNQPPLETPTSPSTLSPTPYSTSSSTQTPVPPSTPSPTPSSAPSSSTPASEKSTRSPSLPTSNTTAAATSNKSTATHTIPKSISITQPNDGATEGETPTGQQNLGQLWLTKYSYWLAALVVGLSATSFAFYWVLCPRVYQTGVSSPSSEDLQPAEPPKVGTSCRTPAFLVVTSFHVLYAGLEMAFGMLVTMYAVLCLRWSGRVGVLLGATYWGSFMTCRVVTFVLFRYIRQSLMMLGGLLLCVMVTGAAFLSFHNELCETNALVWLTVVALGFSMATILPGGVSEIDKVFPRHQAERFQTLGSAVGEMVLPPVIGFVMTMEDTVWMSYIVLAAFVLCTVVAIAIRVLVVRSSESRSPRSARSLPSLENDDLEDVITNTNDETELLAKSPHSQTGSPLNGSGSGTQAVTQMAIQSLMKNISNTKKD